MAYDAHTSAAAEITARCAVLTLSDTRTKETDTSGRRICELLKAEGHTVLPYTIIRDDPVALASLLDLYLRIRDADINVILTNGGTGISRRDNTIAVVESKLTYSLPGFGELFRMLSWNEIGSGALLSRAVGGVAGGKLIFAMPGSTKAVELAMTKLILPELRHLLFELRK
ncbi:MAG: molybdopterin adenylyltransferase [Humisphaera sp.]|nr:molybdopterin adenylyltransferase [Humisphaera sp.]